jgi:tetratricopeptide (TPR) repeat protein
MVGFKDLQHQDSDTWVAAALTEMLGTELSSGESVQVVEDDLVRDALKGLNRDGTGDYSPDVLVRLGEHLGADYILSGSYLLSTSADDRVLRVDLVLRDARTGQRVASYAQQAALQDLGVLVKNAGASIRDKLGIKAVSPESLTGIANAQPPSADVARRLGEAHEDMEHYQAARAKDQILEAIAESPGYAPAYLDLSEAWSALGYRQKAIAAAEQAASRADALPAQLRLQVDAVLQTAKYQWGNAADDWGELVRVRPAVMEYRLHHIEALLAAGAVPAAQAALVQLRNMPAGKNDPRTQLAAVHVDAALHDSKAAAADAQKALDLAQLHETPGLIADAQLELARAQSHLGQIAPAEAAVRAAIEGYLSLGNPHGEAEAHRTLAPLLSAQNEASAARDQDQRAMSIYQRIGDIGGMANVYRDLCEAMWVSGDRDGAQTAAREGLAISREIGDLFLQKWMLQALATISSDESASDEVMRDYREVIGLAERTGDSGGHVWALATYADAARQRGEMSDAQTACAQAIAEAAPLTDPQFSIYSGFTCALVRMDAGEPAEAAAMLRDVVIRSKAAGNQLYLADAQMTLAQIDLENAGCAQALDGLKSAIAAFAAGGEKTGEAQAEALQALCAQDLGDVAGRDRSIARARALRAGITAREEVYIVDIASAQIGFATDAHNDVIARLNDMAADALGRHWLAWALEAKLAAWRLAERSGEKDVAAKLRSELEQSARKHGMGRILNRIQQLSKAA